MFFSSLDVLLYSCLECFMEEKNFKIDLGGKELLISTGKLAGLASGSVTVRYGDTVVLATAVVSAEPKEDIDYFPVLVDYEERLYAAGKISGSRFIKREGRPSENATLTCRLIDRPIRPLFPKDCRNEIQLILTILSVDMVHDPDIPSIIASSCALLQAGAPFEGPVAAVRIGMVDGKLIVGPNYEQTASGELDLVVAGTSDGIMMVEAGAAEVPRSAC